MDVKGFLGDGFLDLEAEVCLKNGRFCMLGSDFSLKHTEKHGDTDVFRGHYADMVLEIVLRKADNGVWIKAGLMGETPLYCESIGWTLRYREKGKNLASRWVPCVGKNVADSGLHPIGKKGKTKPDTRMCGLLHGAHKPCVFMGTRLPQKNLHLYQTELLAPDTVRFRATTFFTYGQMEKDSLQSEETLLLTGLTPGQAVLRYGEHIPLLKKDQFVKPLVGWNSWDYYFTTVRQEDVLENLEFIQKNPVLHEKLDSFVIDDGWQHCEGEWFPNYKFPQGMNAVADKIKECGLTPGVWTNGCQVRELSYPGMRQGEILLKDENGTPLSVNGMYVIDPTHPGGAAYLRDTYSRLYDYGFRIFKVDFVDAILEARKFYDKDSGPYDAIRKLFAIVREAVGNDSHIIGCAYPPECGPGYTNSNRIGVDIHNQWGHVSWILEYLQLSFWENGRMFRIDPDFLLVRGKDTSMEEETNVYNPFEHIPYKEGEVSNRWRRGAVFDRFEAETWANLVVFAGGNLFLSDRLSMLNEEGLKLVYTHLEPEEQSAVPLDLGESKVASVWYLKRVQGGSILLINHQDEEAQMTLPFAEYGLAVPQNVLCKKASLYCNGVFKIRLQRHESAVLNWTE